MSEVKQQCESNDCTRAASTRCYCCNKSICTRHFTEHIEAVRAQVDPLANKINTMAENIRDLTIEHFTETALAKLNQWKNDMHQFIDEIFMKKSKEIEEVVERNKIKFTDYKKQQWETVMKIQEDVKQLAENGDATPQEIKLLKTKLTNIEISLATFQNNFLSINTQLFGQGFVTVSSVLTNPSTVLNTQPSLTLQSSMSPFANYPIAPTLDASIYQRSDFGACNTGLPSTSLWNTFGTPRLAFETGPTTTANDSLLHPSIVHTPGSNPFSNEKNDTMNRRPVTKAKRRGRP